jgi:hypothetical protein
MPARPNPKILPAELIQRRILVFRDKRVLLDSDLARFYNVGARELNRAVARNPDRFPDDFSFYLTAQEVRDLMFQIGTSSSESSESQPITTIQRPHGGRRKPPRVFTEQGVAMLASVLRSQRAAAVSVAIVRAFVQLREMLAGHRQLAGKLAELEQRLEGHDEAIANLFEAIRQLITPDAPTHGRRMGFQQARE